MKKQTKINSPSPEHGEPRKRDAIDAARCISMGEHNLGPMNRIELSPTPSPTAEQATELDAVAALFKRQAFHSMTNGFKCAKDGLDYVYDLTDIVKLSEAILQLRKDK